MTEKEKMLSGELFCGEDYEIKSEYYNSKRIQKIFNELDVSNKPERLKLLKEWIGKLGPHYDIQPPFICEFGKNIETGDNFYVNYGCNFLDVCKIKFGDNVLVGPNVSIFTAGHPFDPELRRTGLAYGRPVTIGNDVWICGNVTIRGGVTIGDNVIIGAGSVVTHDLESNGIYAGNPAVLIRKNEPLTK